MPRVLVACDKFKGTLSATRVRDLLVEAIPGARGFLVADGGDGMLDALRDAGWRDQGVRVAGPTGEPVDSSVLHAPAGDEAQEGTVALEMADLCGLLRLPGEELAPLDAHSTGLGQAIAAAEGAQRLILGVGGSASTDGGTGVLVGLGARLLDADGRDVPPGARHLEDIARLDLSDVPAWLADVEVTLAADVDAPLLGPRGAVAVFGPQKGLDGADAERVEAGMAHWAQVLAQATGRDVRDEPGAGAAGGVGAALLAVLGARRESGIEVIARATGLTEALREADLVVTGEGSLDAQTLMGKTVAGVARLARDAQRPVVAVCGRSTLDAAQERELGVARVYTLAERADSPEDAMERAAELLAQVGASIADDAAGRVAEGTSLGVKDASQDNEPAGGSTDARDAVGATARTATSDTTVASTGPVQVGLTGGIAAGKSTVARRLVERGAVLVDADAQARAVVEPGTEGLAAVVERFGRRVLAADGTLDRAALGAIVFRDEGARRALEAITHPRIRALREQSVEDAIARGARVIVHDIPLLVEGGMADQFDLVLVVHAPVEERVERMVRERGMSEEDARSRIAAQATDAQRRAVADVWLDNSGAPDDLLAAVDAAWDGPIAAALAART